MFSSAFAVALLFSQAAGDAATPAKPDPLDRVVCRSTTHVGSIIPKRKCRTMREWKAQSDGTSDATRRQLETEGFSGGSNTSGQ